MTKSNGEKLNQSNADYKLTETGESLKQLQISQLIETVDYLKQFSRSLLRSISLMRWLGYGLLVLALFDLIAIFLPTRLMNPVWEFQTMGQLVERVPVPLIGLVLVFYGERNYRDQWELPLLKFLSRLALLVGVLFLLLVPLGVSNTVRLDQQLNKQITAQVDQQMAQVQQVKAALATATTKEQMQQLLSRFDGKGRTPEIKDSQQLEKVKKQLSQSIAQSETEMKAQARSTQSSQRLELLKNSVKWNLGALVSSVLFILIWQSTRWARRSI